MGSPHSPFHSSTLLSPISSHPFPPSPTATPWRASPRASAIKSSYRDLPSSFPFISSSALLNVNFINFCITKTALDDDPASVRVIGNSTSAQKPCRALSPHIASSSHKSESHPPPTLLTIYHTHHGH